MNGMDFVCGVDLLCGWWIWTTEDGWTVLDSSVRQWTAAARCLHVADCFGGKCSKGLDSTLHIATSAAATAAGKRASAVARANLRQNALTPDSQSIKLHIISAVRNSFFRGGRSQHNIHIMGIGS